MKKKPAILTDDCQRMLLGVQDTQDLLTGKWKAAIIGALYYQGTMRFMDLKRAVVGIAPRMLSKELKDLEMNNLVIRTAFETEPGKVEYCLTQEGRSLQPVIESMGRWGIEHRKWLLSKKE